MKARYYAEALFEASRGKREEDLDVLVQRITALLEERGHRALLPAIVRELEKLSITRGSKEELVLRVAKESDVEAFMVHIEKDIQTLEAQAYTKKICIDDTIIGGYELRLRGVSIDRTYKRSLLLMYTNLLTNNV